eukprot:tig00001214_g7562.t1
MDAEESKAAAGSSAAPEDTADSSAGLFAKRKRNANLRKRTRAEDGGEEQQDEDDGVVRKDRAAAGPAKPSPFVSTTNKAKKLEDTAFESTRSAVPIGRSDQGATAVLEIDTEADRDARAIRERVLKEEEEGKKGDGLYRGMASYGNLIQKREPHAHNEKMSAGPIRAPAHVRMTCRVDYQPDLCKDYKETGFCGYGDSCKFMHDRGDYKAGWQLDQEWDAMQRAKERGEIPDEDGEGKNDDVDEEGLPWACFICREEFKNPVVTKCQHYFCEKCAVEHHRKARRCFICQQPTGGIFNMATKLAQKVAKRKKEQEGGDEGEEKASAESEKKGRGGEGFQGAGWRIL